MIIKEGKIPDISTRCLLLHRSTKLGKRNINKALSNWLQAVHWWRLEANESINASTHKTRTSVFWFAKKRQLAEVDTLGNWERYWRVWERVNVPNQRITKSRLPIPHLTITDEADTQKRFWITAKTSFRYKSLRRPEVFNYPEYFIQLLVISRYTLKSCILQCLQGE